MSAGCSGKCLEKRQFDGSHSMYQAFISSTGDFPREICWRVKNATEMNQTMRFTLNLQDLLPIF
jgi:hypothetical protein